MTLGSAYDARVYPGKSKDFQSSANAVVWCCEVFSPLHHLPDLLLPMRNQLHCLCSGMLEYMSCPEVQDNELLNKIGISGDHDGCDFTGIASGIAVHKARGSFEPILMQLRRRLTYILNHMLSVSRDLVLHSTENCNGMSPRPALLRPPRVEQYYVHYQTARLQMLFT